MDKAAGGIEAGSSEGALQSVAATFFEQFFYRTPACKLITRADSGAIVAVNDAFMTQFGYSRADLTGRTTLEVGLWSSVADRERSLALAREGPAVANKPARWFTRRGSLRDVLLSCDLVEEAGEEFCLTTVVDVTPVRQLEAALEHSTRRHAQLFDHIRAGVAYGSVIADADESDISVTEMNRAFRTILELMDTSIASLRKTWPELYQQIPSLSGDLVTLAADVALFYPKVWFPRLGKRLDVCITPVGEGYLVVTLDDVTERVRNEESVLQLNDELHSRVARKKALLNSVMCGAEAFLQAAVAQMQESLEQLSSGSRADKAAAIGSLYSMSALFLKYASARTLPYVQTLVDVNRVIFDLRDEVNQEYPALELDALALPGVTAAQAPLSAIFRNLIQALNRLPRPAPAIHIEVGSRSEFVDTLIYVKATSPAPHGPIFPGAAKYLDSSLEMNLASRLAQLHGGQLTIEEDDESVIVVLALGYPAVTDI